MKTLFDLLLHIKSPQDAALKAELTTLREKAIKIKQFVKGDAYDNLLEEIFKYETDGSVQSQKILDYRKSKTKNICHVPRKILNQVHNITHNLKPEIEHINSENPNAKNIIEKYYNDFFGGQSMRKYAKHLVEDFATYSPFSWLVMGLDSYQNGLPVIQPYLIDITSLIKIEQANGLPTALFYSRLHQKQRQLIYLSKDYLVKFEPTEETKEQSESLKNYTYGITTKETVSITTEYKGKHYRVSFLYYGLEKLPAINIGYETLSDSSLFKGNEFTGCIELLKRYARYDNELACIIDKYIKPHEQRIVEKEKTKLSLQGDTPATEKPSERSSLVHDEIEVDNLEDALKNDYLAHFDKLIIHRTPETSTFELLERVKKDTERELQLTILGSEVIDQVTKDTATGKVIDLQKRRNCALKLLGKIVQLTGFMFHTTLQYLQLSQTVGFKNAKDLPNLQLKYTDDFPIKSTAELITEIQAAKAARLEPNIILSLNRQLWQIIYAGDKSMIQKLEVLYSHNPIALLPESEISKVLNEIGNETQGFKLFTETDAQIYKYGLHLLDAIADKSGIDFYNASFEVRREIIGN